MLLQLIVIHYDEDETYIKNFLDVLKLQQWVNFNDFEVLIENDGDKVVYDKEIFKGYPFSIQYHINDWSGRSGVRQCGLNRAMADYVMFCDCDDTFLRFDSLYEIFFNLRKSKPDVLFSTFRTNFVKDGRTTGFRDYYGENVWIHGKCFRTKFLKDNDIQWNKNLNCFEDVYFVRLVDSFNPKKVGVKSQIYAWKYRASSSTRNDGHTEMLDYKNGLISQNEAIKTYIKLKKFREAGIKVFVTMYEVYFMIMLMRRGIIPDRDYTNYPDTVEEMFIDMYRKNKQYLELVDSSTKTALYSVLVDRFFKEKDVYWEPELTLAQYIESLENKYKEN